jgi:hypothetical protein
MSAFYMNELNAARSIDGEKPSKAKLIASEPSIRR